MYYMNTTSASVLESVARDNQLSYLLFQTQFFESRLRNVCEVMKTKS